MLFILCLMLILNRLKVLRYVHKILDCIILVYIFVNNEQLINYSFGIINPAIKIIDYLLINRKVNIDYCKCYNKHGSHTAILYFF